MTTNGKQSVQQVDRDKANNIAEAAAQKRNVYELQKWTGKQVTEIRLSERQATLSRLAEPDDVMIEAVVQAFVRCGNCHRENNITLAKAALASAANVLEG